MKENTEQQVGLALTEGTVRYTPLYEDEAGNRILIGFTDVVRETENEALDSAATWLLDTILYRLKFRGLHTIIVGELHQHFIGTMAGPLGELPILVIGGPMFDAKMLTIDADHRAEMWRKAKAANRESHKNVSLVGEGELAFCEDCKGGEAELWEHHCEVKKTRDRLGLT